MSTSNLNNEIRRLRDENARLKIINQRLEFEKTQQNQKLEAAVAERKLLEDQVHVLFQQIATSPGAQAGDETGDAFDVSNHSDAKIEATSAGQLSSDNGNTLNDSRTDDSSEKTIVTKNIPQNSLSPKRKVRRVSEAHPTSQTKDCIVIEDSDGENHFNKRKKTAASSWSGNAPLSSSSATVTNVITDPSQIVMFGIDVPLQVPAEISRTHGAMLMGADIQTQDAMYTDGDHASEDVDELFEDEDGLDHGNNMEGWNGDEVTREISGYRPNGPRVKQTARKSTGGRPPSWLSGRSSSQDEDDSDHEKASFLGRLTSRTRYVAKPRGDAFLLDSDSLYARLRHLGSPVFPITSSPVLTSQDVRMEVVIEKFGGSKDGLIQRPQSSFIRAHGYTHFLCPTLDTNPHVPQVPGAHGLIFRCELENGIVDNEEERKARGAPPHKVIVGLSPGQWLYMGEYEFERSEPLSPAQWSSLSRKSRDAWVKSIHTSKTGVKAETRAAIAFRKHHKRSPTPSERAALLKNRGKIWESVTIADILFAYFNGAEKIVPWVMKCVGYDEDFQGKLLDDETYRGATNGNGTESNLRRRKGDEV